MKKIRRLAPLLLLPVALTVLGGCASSGQMQLDGEEQQMMIDIFTERKIREALATDPQLSGDRIFVGCVDGVVTLNGRVESLLEKNRAEQLISDIEGVGSVRNNLTTSS